MKSEKREMSFWVFVGFLLLFLVFLFINPGKNSTSSAIIGSTSLGSSPSVVTLIVLFILLIIILAAVFLIFKKIRKKKSNIPPVVKPTVEDSKKEDGKNVDGGDIEELFSENNKPKEEPVEKKTADNGVKDNEDEGIKKAKRDVLMNLQDLKNKIKGMMSQNLNREQIIGSLTAQGITMDQISKAISEVNVDNLRNYVTQALNQGYTKDQIIRNLAAHGWKKEQISRVI